jgi:hypothetical protein
MGAHPKNSLAQPIPWFYFSKNSAHGPGWAGLGRAGPVLARPIRSPGSNGYHTFEKKEDNNIFFIDMNFEIK